MALLTRASLLFVLLAATLSAGFCFSSSVVDDPRRPLDLPSGGRGDDDDDESAPEWITFYGSEYEGDCFCWALDRSGSMGWNGRWGVLQEELSSAILSLSAQAEFGLVFWSSTVIAWRNEVVRASSARKLAAISWAQGLSPEGATFIIPGVEKALNINRSSTKNRLVVIVLSDGEPTSDSDDPINEATEAINQANWDMQEINTIGVEVIEAGTAFLQAVANANGGTYNAAF